MPTPATPPPPPTPQAPGSRRWNSLLHAGGTVNRRGFWWASLTGAVFLVIQFVRWPEPLGMDQGLFSCFGLWLGRGDTPYVDIWDSKPPGLLYLYAAAFRLCGPHAWTVRILDGAGTAAGAALVAWFCRRWSLRGAGLAALIYVLYAQARLFGAYWSAAQAETFLGPLFAASYALLPPGRAVPLLRRHLVIGVLLGTAVLIKVPALLLALPLVLIIVARRAWRSLAAVAVGAGTCLSCAAGYLWANHALDDFVEMLRGYSPLYLQAVTPAHPVAAALGAARLALSSAGGLLLPALFLGIAAWLPARHDVPAAPSGPEVEGSARVSARRKTGLRLAAVWWAGGLGMVLAQRQLAGYHFLALLAPSAVLTGTAWATWVHRLRHRWGLPVPRAGMPLVLLAGLWAHDALACAPVYRPDLRFRCGLMSRTQLWNALSAGTFQPAVHARIGRYLRTRTHPGQRILVWGLAPDIYFYARRRAATRYYFHHLLLTRAPLSRRFRGLEERRRDFMIGLRQSPPAYILVAHGDANSFEPLPSDQQLRRFPALRNFVARHYTPVHRMGTFSILRCRDL